jgi:hypothetical protein
MTMAAASIEGSPLRDAIRGPFERLGIVPPESVRDGAAPGGAPAPVALDVATGSQADQADPESATAGGFPSSARTRSTTSLAWRPTWARKCPSY